MARFAWVTLATNDSYSLGGLVLAHSLRQVGTAYQKAVLVTPGVTNAMRDQLRSVFDAVVEVNVLDSGDATNLRLLQRPELGVTFTKLHCWRLTQYEKCVFLDADTLVLQNADELFEREEFSAAPDVGWPDCFNSGVFVYRPSNETYEKLVSFALERGSFDGGDQGLLNLYFSDWAHKDISKHLPFIYNMCSTACYSYLPAFKQYGSDVKIIHFIGSSKPWLQYFDTETRLVQASQDLQHLLPVLQRWWDLFFSFIHPSLSSEMAPSKSPAVVHMPPPPSLPPPYPPAPFPQDPNEHYPASDYKSVWDPWDDYEKSLERASHVDHPCNGSHVSQLPETIVAVPETAVVEAYESQNTNAHRSVDITHCNIPEHIPTTHWETVHRNEPDLIQSVPATHAYVPSTHHIQHIHQHIPATHHTEHIPVTHYTEHIPVTHHTEHIPVIHHPESIPHNLEPIPANHHHEPSPVRQSNQIPVVHESVPPVRIPTPPFEFEPHCTVANESTLHPNGSGRASPDESAGLAAALSQVKLGEPRSPGQLALEDHLRRQGWEVGNIDYLGRDSFDNIWRKILETIDEPPVKESATAAPDTSVGSSVPVASESTKDTEPPQAQPASEKTQAPTTVEKPSDSSETKGAPSEKVAAAQAPLSQAPQQVLAETSAKEEVEAQTVPAPAEQQSVPEAVTEPPVAASQATTEENKAAENVAPIAPEITKDLPAEQLPATAGPAVLEQSSVAPAAIEPIKEVPSEQLPVAPAVPEPIKDASAEQPPVAPATPEPTVEAPASAAPEALKQAPAEQPPAASVTPEGVKEAPAEQPPPASVTEAAKESPVPAPAEVKSTPSETVAPVTSTGAVAPSQTVTEEAKKEPLQSTAPPTEASAVPASPKAAVPKEAPAAISPSPTEAVATPAPVTEPLVAAPAEAKVAPVLADEKPSASPASPAKAQESSAPASAVQPTPEAPQEPPAATAKPAVSAKEKAADSSSGGAAEAKSKVQKSGETPTPPPRKAAAPKKSGKPKK